jgi:hypothetical protein
MADEHDAIVNGQAQKIENLLKTIQDLQREGRRTTATADEFTIDPFDNTLDQVSEGHLKVTVEALNNSIDEFVMNLMELASRKPVHTPNQKVTQPSDVALYAACSGLAPKDDNRALFMEGLLHHRIILALSTRFFQGNLGVSLATPFDTAIMEKFYINAVAKKGKSVSSCADGPVR